MAPDDDDDDSQALLDVHRMSDLVAPFVIRVAATLRVAVYLAIASVWFFALVETIRSLHLEAWQPFAFSAFIVVTSLMLLVSLSAPRRPETGEPLRHSA